jgi:pilus assembly protein Flp/PilA
MPPIADSGVRAPGPVNSQRQTSRKDHLMSAIFSRFIRDDSGATAIEYGLIAGLIAVVVVTSITTLGTKLTNTFTNVSNTL